MVTTNPAVIAALGALAVLFVGWRVRFWWIQGKKLQVTGHVPPPMTFLARGFHRFAARTLSFLFVGPIRVIGRENVKHPGRVLVLGNHQFELDFAVTATALQRTFRHLGTASEMKGLRGMLAAWTGHYAVQSEAGKAKGAGIGEVVVETTSNILAQTSSQWVLYYPQGKLVRENVLRQEDFRTGAARSLNRAAEKVEGQTLSVLPVAIHYDRDPRYASWFHRVVNACGLKGFRKFGKIRNFGATVVIGKPIAYSSLPADTHEATEVVRTTIQSLLDVAQQSH